MYELILWLCFGGSIRDLGDVSYATRQAAEERLARHAYFSWRACRGRSSNPEQARRARRIVAAYLAVPGLGTLPEALGRPQWQAGKRTGPRESSFFGGEPLPKFATEENGWQLTVCVPGNTFRAWLAELYHRRAGAKPVNVYWLANSPGGPCRLVLAAESRQATALLAADLLAIGLPRSLVVRLFAGGGPRYYQAGE